MASGRFMEEMMREHEQSLLESACGGLFDHIDDLLDFPKDDCAADVLLLDAPVPGSPLAARVLDACGLPPVKPEQPAFLALPPPPPTQSAAGVEESAFMAALGDGHIGSCDVLDMDMDLAQLEWLSGLLDDASIPTEPAFAACAQPIIRASALSANAGVVLPDHTEEDALFRSSSPTSVLEDSAGGFNANKNGNGGGGGSSASSSSSSASSSSESFSGAARPWSVPVSPRPEPPVFVVPARARSKRSRASAFPTAIRAAAPPPEATILVPTPMYWPTTSSYSEPESIAESNSSQPPAMKKKKKAKRPAPPVTSDAEGDGDADYEEGSGGGGAALPPGAVRRCTHCQIEKTPQWRAGPLGPKTLCNACGVRYKSGRLFPEYRPAASPTFVPAVHSNSHKKVVEMRQKVEPKGDDLLQFIRRRD
ncbi:uncharacterized protein [Lolium perenne]|uniref:uncharacterized protein n=1 Tax=Lolium perenne TaxID=4522 RepID=UPI0021EAA0EE|nr:uncharacterized protein LOC127305477 [Lolium perenne]XP_051191853.1 uncharacterized protein LOC127305477 [Lolium perenne]